MNRNHAPAPPMFGEHFVPNTALSPSLLARIMEWAREDLGEPGLSFEPLVGFPFAYAYRGHDGLQGPPVADPLTLEIQAYLQDGNGGSYTGCTHWRFDLREIVEVDFEDCDDKEHARKFALALRTYAEELLASIDVTPSAGSATLGEGS